MKRLSDAEWKVMRVLWNNKECNAKEVLAAIDEAWALSTVRTLLQRLVEKGAISYTHNKNVYVYHPLISEQEASTKETKSFLQRVYGEGLKTAMVNFIQAEQLSAQDIDELTMLLEDKKQALHDNNE